jgi:hypothetical protein
MIDVDRTKYDPTKLSVISKFKRLVPPPKAGTQVTARQPEADAVASEFDASKGGVVLQSVAGGDDAASPDVDVRDIHSGAGRPATTGVFSPGNAPDLDLRCGEVSSVSTYASAINGHWQRGVEAFMQIARLCADANAHLRTAQKTELIQALPFGEATFSKFAQIGTDTRLHTPEIQRLLPPHYTTMYAVTLLTDEELSLAIAEKVVHPDMKRALLERWRKSRKLGHVPSPKGAATDSPVVGLPIDSTQDAVTSGALPFTVSDDSRRDRYQLAGARDDASAPEAVATAAVVAGPLTPPPGDDDIPAFLYRRPLSAEDQRVFNAIMAALNGASTVVRERVKAELVRANARSGSAAKAISSRRHDDDASAIPNQPIANVGPAYTADAAERGEAVKPQPAGEASRGLIPDAPEHAHAGIKYRDIQVPGFTTIRTNFVVVRRKRHRPRKVSGPLENSPF